MNRIAVIQARMSSARLPGKVMAEIEGRPMIAILLQRLRRARLVDDVVLATSLSRADDELADFVLRAGCRVYRGSESDVLERVIEAAAGADSIVRITADCPLTDPEIVDSVCAAFDGADVDYSSNVDPPSFPDGLDVEVVSMAALKRVHESETEPRFREHVTLSIRERGGFSRINVPFINDLSRLRWTVDEPTDLEVIRRVFRHFRPRLDFRWSEVLALSQQDPDLFAANADIMRNEGLTMTAEAKRRRSGSRESE
jgi:spore coat polysaccharide biosynthesis protein SpsF (cytidylyltransferase family)